MTTPAFRGERSVQRRDTILSMQMLLAQLRALSEHERLPMLVYLVEMAETECKDVLATASEAPPGEA